MFGAHSLSLIITTVILTVQFGLGPAALSENEVGQVYVRPSDTLDCMGQLPCHTFAEYLTSWRGWFTSDRIFHFLPGSHTVNETMSLELKSLSNVTMSGITPSAHYPTAHIQCEGMLEFQFSNSKYLNISNMAFIRCGRSDQDGIHAALTFNATQYLTLRNIIIEESYGYGMLGVNMLMNSSLLDCVFDAKQQLSAVNRRGITGGNVHLVYSGPRRTTGTNKLTVSNCTFINGVIASKRAEKECSGGGGLGVFMLESKCGIHYCSQYNLMLSIFDCKFYNNSAPFGANLLIVLRSSDFNSSINIKNSIFYNGKADYKGGGIYILIHRSVISVRFKINISDTLFLSNSAQKGGALAINSDKKMRTLDFKAVIILTIERSVLRNNFAVEGGGIYAQLIETMSPDYKPVKKLLNLFITNCKLINNNASRSGGGAYLKLYPSNAVMQEDLHGNNLMYQYNLLAYVVVSTSNFSGNIAEMGSALAVAGNDTREVITILSSFTCHAADVIENVTIQSTVFHNNTVHGTSMYNSAALYINNIEHVFLRNCHFLDNRGSAIYANITNIHFTGNHTFVGNVAHSGGALHLDCSSLGQSMLYLSSKKTIATLYIADNHAMQYGGAIAISERCNGYNRCSLQFSWEKNQVIMKNNSAAVAGDSIYGRSLESCSYYIIWWHISLNDYYSTSAISSPAYKVCLCTGMSKGEGCNTTAHREVFPGETFTISAITVGLLEGASPAIVRTNVISIEPAQLGPRQNVQDLGRECGELTFSVLTAATNVELHLEIESSLGSRYPPSIVTVEFQTCPFGFNLSAAPPYHCNCMPHISAAGVECNITTQTIHCPANMWIGNYSGGITVHSNCPFDYCKPGSINISLWNEDEQCAHKHSGILCGECRAGLSAALGTSQCLNCSNYFLLLLVPFALSGILLVLILFCCNLTVSTGTINGLIFYANIVRVNNSIFFPQGDTTIITKFLGIFIAWLNLDLGFKACFFNGMNMYTKIWLQFLFPVYVWVLAGIIIYSSRYSFIVSKLAGSNSVPVLATLFLLSFAKLLRTIIAAVSPITLVNEHEEESLVWLLDGNVPYLKGRHIGLFGMALLVTFLYIIPFTLFVLLGPCLQARSDYKMLGWVNKLKPLLDAYQGPYRDQFRYWTGLMLAFRILLFSIFAANALGDPRVNLLAIVSSMLGIPIILNLYNSGGVYKKHMTHKMEAFFILNLTIFAAATLLLKVSHAPLKSQEIVTAMLVTSAFIAFCAIVAHHSYEQIKRVDTINQLFKSCIQKVLPQSVLRLINTNHELVGSHQGQPNVNGGRASDRNSMFNTPELREPLLADCY